MSVVKALALAISCFTHLPAPRVEWSPENMRYMMMWFPVIGLLVGAFVALWVVVSDAVGFGNVLRAVGITLVPLAVTGGFHLDGFMDVVDAQMSHAEPDKKRAILKDSHIGAFAAMFVAGYLLLYFGIATRQRPQNQQYRTAYQSAEAIRNQRKIKPIIDRLRHPFSGKKS